MTLPSLTHLVLIPSYNPGEKVYETVRAARRQWHPVWVVVDGSTDGTAEGLQALEAHDPGLRVIVLPGNCGKGAAVLHGVELAMREGYTHALTIDSDGQHPAELIPRFMSASQERPEAMVLGVPVFDASAPRLRVRGRRAMRPVARGWPNCTRSCATGPLPERARKRARCAWPCCCPGWTSGGWRGARPSGWWRSPA